MVFTKDDLAVMDVFYWKKDELVLWIR